MAPLTVPEFIAELDLTASLPIDRVCQRFVDDANRALVWSIRFCALTAWCGRADMAAWLKSDPSHSQRASEVAASFRLNGDWEFDPEEFRSAVEAVVARASRNRPAIEAPGSQKDPGAE